MPIFDLCLPPKTYSAWRRKEPIHPVAAAFALIARWIEAARQRRALAMLDEHSLRDIGITRAEALTPTPTLPLSGGGSGEAGDSIRPS